MDRDVSPLEIHHALVDWAAAGRRFALAVILQAEGSTPRKAGVKALIEADGKISGTLGGGAVEAEAQRRAVEACRSGQAAVFVFDLTGPAAGEPDPICGGVMRILIDPEISKYIDAFGRTAEALEQRRRGALLTRIIDDQPPRTSVKWLGEDDIPSAMDFPGRETVRECMRRETARYFMEAPQDARATLVEPVIPPPRLLVAGGGHVGQALARLGVFCGFEVTVIDDRPEFTDPALFPQGIRTQCGGVAEAIAAFPIGADTFIVIVTRGHQHDAVALAACIDAPAAYVGMIGSQRKVALIRKDFIESGRATEESFARVHAPIGLDIGAVSVPEIALSIMAQLVDARRSFSKDDPYEHDPR